MDRDEAGYHCWRPSACLEATGADAFEFLQGQFTNDLCDLDKVPAVYGLWLDRRGHCVGDSFVVRCGNGEMYLLVSYASPASMIREKLEAHIIADDVTLTDRTGEAFGVTLVGRSAAERAASLGERMTFPGRRGIPGAVEWIGFREPSGPAGREINALEMERSRIDAMVPSIPTDVGPNDLPNEAGLDRDAISHTKGCYLGQEVIARIRSMGQVRRKLVRVRSSSAAPSTGAVLHQGGRDVGELRSLVPAGTGFVGMAMLKLPRWHRDEPLSLSPQGAADIAVDGET